MQDASCASACSLLARSPRVPRAVAAMRLSKCVESTATASSGVYCLLMALLTASSNVFVRSTLFSADDGVGGGGAGSVIGEPSIFDAFSFFGAPHVPNMTV